MLLNIVTSAVNSPVCELNRSGLVKTKGYGLISAPAQDRPSFTVKLSGLSGSSARAADVQQWELTAGLRRAAGLTNPSQTESANIAGRVVDSCPPRTGWFDSTPQN